MWFAGVPLLSGCPTHGPQTEACVVQGTVPTCGLQGGGGLLATALWDGGVAADGGVTNGLLDAATCQALCTCAPQTSYCQVVDSSLVECRFGCVGGRAPPGLRQLSGVDASPGSWLARMAELEAAAVHAFLHLARELDAHRLPRFAAAALEAAGHERRHATQVTALALRHGHCPVAPDVGTSEVRSLEALALDNAGEGCGRELFGAVLNAHQGRVAGDPRVAETMGAIAVDEAGHAGLSLELAAELMPRLTVAQRRRAREAQAEVLTSLAADEVAAPARAALGLMDRAQATATARRLLDERRL